MPIRVDYSPVPALLGLAKAAGEQVAQEKSAQLDIAFTNMAMQTATRNAEIAARIQAQDQAHELQQAALLARTRTTTPRQRVTSPIGDSVLARMQYTDFRNQQSQNAQLRQLDSMRVSGVLTGAEYETAKLGVMGDNEPLVRSAVQPEKPRLSSAQELMLIRQRYSRERKPYEANRRLIQEWLMSPGLSPDRKREFEAQLQETETTLRDIESHQRAEEETVGTGRAVVDPMTKETSTGAGTPAGTLAGQPSLAAMQRALAHARLYFLQRGEANPSKADLMAVTKLIMASGK